MESQAEAEAAIESLNGKDVAGRQIVVNPSKPKVRSY
jgi:RNA recognition motif-containing protein